MRKSPVVIALLLILGFLTFPPMTAAKKTLPRLQKAPRQKTSIGASRGIKTSVRFRPDRKAIIVSFSEISKAKSVSYTLSYDSRGTAQGAGGMLQTAQGDSQTREILFGTCSHGVCRYDSNISNAKFTVTTILTNGQKIVKSFRLKL